MKKHSSFIKALSVFLSVLMLLSCVSAFPVDVLFTAKAETTYTVANGLTVDDNGDFTILQVADMQGCYPLPDQWLNALRLSIATAQPDLIVLTGDNVVSTHDQTGFENTVQQIVNEFYTYKTSVTGSGSTAVYSTEKQGIPFAVTFGNHDYEANNKRALETQLNAYMDAAAKAPYYNGTSTFIPLNTADGLTVGTGYIDVFDEHKDENNDGKADVVQRVILINTGSNQGGGYARAGADPTNTEEPDAYDDVVSAVNTWTTTSYPTTVFQHIPLREFYTENQILKKDSSGYPAYSTNDSSISGSYSPNYANSSVSGIYTEQCCCSYYSTEDMYKALAKDNVTGIFYGHDHGNTLTGVTNVYGQSLRQGYGGGLNTQWNGSGTSQFSYYTINSAYSGVTDTAHFNKESHAYAEYLSEIGGIYGPKTKLPTSATYVQELGAEGAPLSIFQTRSWSTAKDNVKKKFPNVIDKMANDSGANADLNKGCGGNTDYVAVGYKTTTTATDAITGIIGFRTTSGTHPKEITVYLQDNTPIKYHLEDNNCDCSGGISDYYTLIYWTKDPRAGAPITNLYITYEGADNSWSHYDYNFDENSNVPNYKVDSWVEQNSDGSWYLQEWRAFDYNTGCGSSTPYIYIEYASVGTEDVTRAYYDLLVADNKYGGVDDGSAYTTDSYNAYITARNELENFRTSLIPTNENPYPYSSKSNDQINKAVKTFVDAYNNLTLKPSENGRQVTSGDSDYPKSYQVYVPEAIYLTPSTGSATAAQYFLNDKIDSNGNLVPAEAYSTSGTFGLSCADATNISVSYKRLKKSNGGYTFGSYENGVTLNLSGSSVSGTKLDGSITASGTSYDPGLTAGDTGMIEWCFTVTRPSGTEKVYAYTVVYSPYLDTVAAISAGNIQEASVGDTAVWTAIFGIHGVEVSRMTSISLTGTGAYSQGTDADRTCKYKYDLTNHSNLPNDYYGGAAPTTTNILASDDGSVNDNSKSGAAYWYKGWKNGTDGRDVAGGRGFIRYDSSRASKLTDIPYFYVHSYCGSFRQDGTWSYTIDVSNDQAWYMTNSSNVIQQYSTYGQVVAKNKDGIVTKITDPSLASINLGDGFVFYNRIHRTWGQRNGIGTHQHRDIRAIAACKFYATNKKPLRDSINNYLQIAPQSEWYTDPTKFNDFMNKYIAVSFNLGNPTATETSVASLSNAFVALDGVQKGTVTVNGQSVKRFTLETNYSLTRVLNSYGQVIGYRVADVLYPTYRYEGKIPSGQTVGAGIGQFATINVKPYAISGYNYVNWLRGDDTVLRPGDSMSTAQYNALRNEDINTSTPTNYGRVDAAKIVAKQNEFYFYYLPETVNLTFAPNGGNLPTGVSATVASDKGSSFTVGITPTRSGYVFDGWEVTSGDGIYSNLTNKFTFGSQNTTLTAKWIKASTLSINGNGGSYTGNLLYFKDGKLTAASAQVSDEMSYSASYQSDGKVIVEGYKELESDTAPNNEGTYMSDIYVDLIAGHTYEVNATCSNSYSEMFMMKDGAYSVYHHIGVSSASSNVIHDVFTVSSASSWSGTPETGTYHIRIDQNGHTVQGAFTFSDFSIVDVTDIASSDSLKPTVKQLEKSSRVISDPVRKGWVFTGWTLKTASGADVGTNETAYGKLVENADGGYIYIFGTENAQIVANWVEEITVTFDNCFDIDAFTDNSTSFKLGGNGKTPGDTLSYNAEAKTIRVKDDGIDGVKSDGTLSSDVYTSYGNATTYYSVPVTPGEEYEFSLEVSGKNAGQFFVFGYPEYTILTSGYPTATSTPQKITKTFTIPTGVTSLQFRFGFSSSGADVTYSNITLVPASSKDYLTKNNESVVINNGSAIGRALPSPVRDGYRFLGWYSDIAFANDTDDLSLDYKKADGTLDSAKISELVSLMQSKGYNKTIGTLDSSEKVDALINDFLSSKGYVSSDTLINLPQNASPYVRLWSKWTPNDLVVNYNGNGATGGSTEASSFKYDANESAKTNGFTNKNCEFLYWNTESDGTGNSIAENASIKNLIPDGEITLYAQWAENNNMVYDFALEVDGTYSYTATKPASSSENTEQTSNILNTLGLKPSGQTFGFKSSPIYAKNTDGWQRIAAVPASNVMFEESALDLNVTTKDAEKNYPAWENKGTSNYKQTLSKYNVFGYSESDAYAKSNAYYSNGTHIETKVKSGFENTISKAATFKFYGTGFDLISACDKNTGILSVQIKGGEGASKVSKTTLVDTYFSEGSLTQVPIYHIDGLASGVEYTVTVKGVYLSSAGALNPRTPASNTGAENVGASYDVRLDILAQLDEMGIVVDDPDELELMWCDDNSVLNGGMGNAIKANAASNRGEGATSDSGANDVESLTCIIDGVRIYKPLSDEDETAYYPPTEKGATYVNLINNISDPDLFKNTVAYVEYKKGDTQFEEQQKDDTFEPTDLLLSNYQKNGPQNEIYLMHTDNADKQHGIAFEIYGFNAVSSKVMVSFRAVNADEKKKAIPKINGKGLPIGTETTNEDSSITYGGELTSATEMYYDITDQIKNDVIGGCATIVIENIGTAMLAVNNVKLVGCSFGTAPVQSPARVRSMMMAPMKFAAVQPENGEEATSDVTTPDAPVIEELFTIVPDYVPRPEPGTVYVEPSTEPATENTTDPTTEPVTEPATEPTTELVTEPVSESPDDGETEKTEKNFFEKIINFFKTLFTKIKKFFTGI